MPLKFDTLEELLLLELEVAEPSEETAIIDNKKFAAEDDTSDLWLWFADSDVLLSLKLLRSSINLEVTVSSNIQ